MNRDTLLRTFDFAAVRAHMAERGWVYGPDGHVPSEAELRAVASDLLDILDENCLPEASTGGFTARRLGAGYSLEFHYQKDGES